MPLAVEMMQVDAPCIPACTKRIINMEQGSALPMVCTNRSRQQKRTTWA